MKKILLLGDANSTHTIKWVTGIASRGYEVAVFSLSQPTGRLLQESGVEVYYSSFAGKNKLLYPFALYELRRVIKGFKPGIIHSHYASSYGLLGALSRFHPLVISAWGSDLYNFPRKNTLNKAVFKYNLRKADKICSVSNTMAQEIKKYTSKDISVVPFGVDINVFKPFSVTNIFPENSIVIGTVKTLEPKYGISYLIEAFSILKKRKPELPLKLLIVGKGSLLEKLNKRAKFLGIENDTVFTASTLLKETPRELYFWVKYHNMMNVSVFPSIEHSESFGVAIVEAMACEKPVVVSDVGGLPEVVENNVTGLVVPAANAEKLADAIEKLVMDEHLRSELGKQGRLRVEKLYNWENNLSSMIRIYDELLNQKDK